jgi:hypothetical protein
MAMRLFSLIALFFLKALLLEDVLIHCVLMVEAKIEESRNFMNGKVLRTAVIHVSSISNNILLILGGI